MGGPKYAGLYFDYRKKFWIYNSILLCHTLFIDYGICHVKTSKEVTKILYLEVFDIYGQKATPDGLRLAFKTHDVAESYAQSYRDSYNGQYKFCVIGVKD